MTTGRTGSDYLAGCLDGVNNIMTFSGKFNYQIYFKNNKQKIQKEILITKFINGNKQLFGYDKIEDLNVNINTKKFKKIFLKISNKKLNQKEFLIKLYESYHIVLNRKLSKSNVIIHHAHSRVNTINFLKDFPRSKILITIRDPRANLKSGLINWWKFDQKRKDVAHVYMYLRRIRDDFRYILTKKNKKKFVKLEEMGEKKTKENILKFLGVRYDKRVNISTFANIPWNGDKLSNFKIKNKGKFNNKVIYNGWSNFFTEDDKVLINFIYSDYKEFYEMKKINFKNKIYLFFRGLLPFNFEILAIKNQSVFSKRFLINILIYLKRVFYIQLLLCKIDLFDYEKKN